MARQGPGRGDMRLRYRRQVVGGDAGVGAATATEAGGGDPGRTTSQNGAPATAGGDGAAVATEVAQREAPLPTRWESPTRTVWGTRLVALAVVVAVAVAVGAHWSSLRCGFVFDDHLAVQGNHDAYARSPLLPLFTHDFWGKPLGKVDSHKSYRPLTVLTLRLNALLDLAGVLPDPGFPPPVADGYHATELRPLHPYGYHMFNVVVHGAATALLVALAWRVVRPGTVCARCCGGVQEDASARAQAHAMHGDEDQEEAPDGTGAGGGDADADEPRVVPRGHARPAMCTRCDAVAATAAALAGVLFAAHPAHVESVVGVVGRADILCAALCMAALSMYADVAGSLRAVDGTMLAYFGAAILCKELGVTLIVVCVALELLPTPAPVPEEVVAAGPEHVRGFCGARWRAFVLRISRLGAVVATYLALRAALIAVTADDGSGGAGAGAAAANSVSLADSGLIRQAENPFHFLRGVSWLLSVLHIQVRYLGLLLAPTELCAEYSYNCIPAVTLWDARASVCGAFLVALLAIAGALLRRMYSNLCVLRGVPAAGGDLDRAGDGRPGLLLVAGVGATLWGAAMLPSSHLFITIGTLMAERLLYLPSVGVSLSVAALLAAVLGHTSYHLQGLPSLASAARRVPAWVATALRAALVAVLLAAVAWCVHRTAERTQDWRTDETLFMSALDVCPNSAKHHYQVGLLRMNQHNVSGAWRHFKAARGIDPDFCDVAYGLGQVYIARDDQQRARRWLRKAIHCPFVSQNAFVKLQLVWSALLQSPELAISVREEMGEVFTEIGDMEQAATNLREVAVMHIHGNQSGGLVTAQRLLSRAVRLAPHRCDCAYWLATAMERHLGHSGHDDGGHNAGVDRPFGPSDVVQARAAASAPHDVAALMHKFWNVIVCGVRPNATDGESPDQVSHSPPQDSRSAASSAMIALDALARMTAASLRVEPGASNGRLSGAAMERLGDASVLVQFITSKSAETAPVELGSIAASQWVQAGQAFLSIQDAESAARCFAKALMLPEPDVPCVAHTLLGRAVLEALVDMDANSPGFGDQLRASPYGGGVSQQVGERNHGDLWDSAWLVHVAKRAGSGLAAQARGDGSGAVVGGGGATLGQGRTSRGLDTDTDAALRVSELSQFPAVVLSNEPDARWMSANRTPGQGAGSIPGPGRRAMDLDRPLTVEFAMEQLKVAYRQCGAMSDAGQQAAQLLSSLGVDVRHSGTNLHRDHLGSGRPGAAATMFSLE